MALENVLGMLVMCVLNVPLSSVRLYCKTKTVKLKVVPYEHEVFLFRLIESLLSVIVEVQDPSVMLIQVHLLCREYSPSEREEVVLIYPFILVRFPVLILVSTD